MVLFDDVTKKHKDGITIDLFVTPNAKKSVFPAGFNRWRNRIDIKVCAAAKDNLANIEVVKSVAEFFNIPIKCVCITSGKKEREKTVLLENISKNTAFKMLKEKLNGL